MEQVKQEVNACGENSECLDKMNTKIQEDLNNFPERITDSSKRSSYEIVALLLKTRDCCEKFQNDLVSRGTKIYKDIVRCINSKF